MSSVITMHRKAAKEATRGITRGLRRLHYTMNDSDHAAVRRAQAKRERKAQRYGKELQR